MALAVHCQLNPQVRLFVPTVMAPKLAYRRGKREGGEEPVSKHQIRSGDGRWEERRGVGWLNPRRETKTKGRNGDREKEMKEYFLRTSSVGGGGGGYAARLFLLFSFPCSADHERDWPPCKVVFSGWQPLR